MTADLTDGPGVNDAAMGDAARPDDGGRMRTVSMKTTSPAVTAAATPGVTSVRVSEVGPAERTAEAARGALRHHGRPPVSRSSVTRGGPAVGYRSGRCVTRIPLTVGDSFLARAPKLTSIWPPSFTATWNVLRSAVSMPTAAAMS